MAPFVCNAEVKSQMLSPVWLLKRTKVTPLSGVSAVLDPVRVKSCQIDGEGLCLGNSYHVARKICRTFQWNKAQGLKCLRENYAPSPEGTFESSPGR